MTHNINLALDLPKVREAYNNKMLAAQRSGSKCAYRSSAGPCAVGAMLPDDVAQQVIDDGLNGASIRALINKGLLSVHGNRDPQATHELRALQDLHDTWLRHGLEHSTTRHLRASAQEHFESVLIGLEKKYCGENGQAQ